MEKLLMANQERGTNMTVSNIMVKMIEYSKGNLHDINHLMKVYAYAKTIAECENVTADEQKTVEIAAIVHDIACPLCREKYGNTDGKLQEKESAVLVWDFLDGMGVPQKMADRIVFLVEHHHTPQEIDGIDYQILIEADYLVNADESTYKKENIINVMNCIFKTHTGKKLLQSIYGV